MQCLDNSRKVWLLGCPSYIIIPHMVAIRTAFADIENISLVCISLGNCPVLRAVREDG